MTQTLQLTVPHNQFKSDDPLNLHGECKCEGGRVRKSWHIQTGQETAGTASLGSGVRLAFRRLMFISTRDFHIAQKLGLSSKNKRQMHC